MKFWLTVFVLFPILLFADTLESVLNKGTWHKVSVSESGIHRIDYNFLKNAGIDVDNIDPRKLRLFGNGGGMLPQLNKSPRVDDLAENAIEIVGEGDGKFDANDFILFYAQGPNTWKTDINSSTFVHQRNIYSDKAYYFITIGEGDGKRIKSNLSPAVGNIFKTDFDERLYLEDEVTNVIKSGRDWFGDNFSTEKSRNYTFNLLGFVQNSLVKIKTQAAITYGSENNQFAIINFQYKLNNVLLGGLSIGRCQSCGMYQIGSAKSSIFEVSPSIADPSNTIINVSVNSDADPNGKSYLDYIIINFQKTLSIYNGQTAFRILNQTSDINYKVSQATSNSKVWDVSQPYNAFLVAKSEGTELDFSSKFESVLHEYIAFTPENITKVPTFEGKVANQNIHGLATPSLIIVTHSSLLSQANELAQYRKSQGITAEVVTTDQVYNEFSSGAQDLTAIRDMCRMFYKRGGLNNLLLFGSCSYDYKDRVANNTNLVPCYEAKNSLNTVDSYSSEDYFAFFGDNDGDWEENGSLIYNHLMQIGVGRLPARNAQEAQNIVDKLKHYESSKTLGKWRNKAAFIADNGDSNIFLRDTENLTNKALGVSPSLNVFKIYLDAFQDKSTPKGNEVPGAVEAIRNSINQGALIINYVGHGGTEGLSQEGVITKDKVESWENLNKLPFWVTATCDYSTYDDPSKNSSGVITLTKANGGGIGIISATRAVYSTTNYLLNDAFYNAAFKRQANGQMPTLGEIIKNTKNESVQGVSNRSYSLLGDPSMKLNFPEFKAIISKINNKKSDTLRALSEVKIEGKICSYVDTTTKSAFNGEVILEFYDKADTFLTLGQQNSIATKVTQRSSIFYSGKTVVKNGKYSAIFIVPKDINYRFGQGKISIYAYDMDQNIDAGGYNSDIIVGGGTENVIADNAPPEISLYLNDTTFKSGDLTNPEPLLIAKLFDQSGINIARSGLGHEITAIIDEKSEDPIILNDFYESEVNSYKQGKVKFQFNKLEEGNHSLTLKAWDTHNNSSEKKIDFIVSSIAQIKISQLFNYPNPAVEQTSFHFIHNYAGEDLALDIEIIDRMGKSVYKISDVIKQSSGTIDYAWDINSTNNIAAGSYVYRCKIKSLVNNSEAMAVEKLVIIR